MTRKSAFLMTMILGLLVGCFAAVPHAAKAQDFPYAVPQAPEFDTEGNHAPSGEADTEDPPRRKRSRARHEQSPPSSQSDYRAVRPYVSQEPSPSVQPPPGPKAPLGASYQGPTMAPAPPAAAPAPPGSAQNRPDCSQYPMMIARSRSEPEMREIAKQYLTCLLMNGWNMEQARSHVIATIESTFRLAR
jgi:hypothetical protein